MPLLQCCFCNNSTSVIKHHYYRNAIIRKSRLFRIASVIKVLKKCSFIIENYYKFLFCFAMKFSFQILLDSPLKWSQILFWWLWVLGKIVFRMGNCLTAKVAWSNKSTFYLSLPMRLSEPSFFAFVILKYYIPLSF